MTRNYIRAASRTRRDWTPDQDAALKELLSNGLTHQTIARALERKPSSIASRLRTLARHAEEAQDDESGPEAPPKPQSTRNCLCCRKQFASEGHHNRLCPTCRLKSVGPYDL